MAYPETCAGALGAMKNSAANSLIYSGKALTHINAAESHWNLNQDHLAIQDIISALRDVNLAAAYAGYGYAPFDYVGPWWWYFTNCIGETELTMADILDTMLAAEPYEINYFVGIVDAYRQSIWNKPFNVEFFAALARGFEE